MPLASASARRSAASSTGCGPGTVRLPPWPDKVPLTRGHAAHVARRRALRRRPRRPRSTCWSRTASAGGLRRRSTRRHRRPARPAGRCSACATRSRSSPRGPRSTASCCWSRCSRSSNLIVGWQFVFFFIWWGAASSKLNRHFPFVISVMISQHALEPLTKDEGEALPRLPGGPAARRAARRSAPTSAPRSSSGCRCVLLLSSGGHDRHARGDRDDHLPRPHHLDVRARRAARVEPVHDLRRSCSSSGTTATCRSRRSTTRC